MVGRHINSSIQNIQWTLPILCFLSFELLSLRQGNVPDCEWQPLVVHSVFIASSSSPKCVWFWEFSVIDSFGIGGVLDLRSLWQRVFWDLCPITPCWNSSDPRDGNLGGIMKPTSGKWKSERPEPSCKCFVFDWTGKDLKGSQRGGYWNLWIFQWCNCVSSLSRKHSLILAIDSLEDERGPVANMLTCGKSFRGGCHSQIWVLCLFQTRMQAVTFLKDETWVSSLIWREL